MHISRINRKIKERVLGAMMVIVALLPLFFGFIAPIAEAQTPPATTAAPATQADVRKVDNAIDAKNGPVTPDPKAKANEGPAADTQWGQRIGNIFVSMASFFTWVGGSILDACIKYLVLGMGGLVNASGLKVAIDNVWKMIRDISNLAFIFGFIYVGIRTIINAESAETKRFLSSIIIGALLVNFSLFITKAVIEASNLIASEMYKAMLDPSSTGGISAGFANVLGIVTIFTAPDPKVFAELTTGGNIWFYIMASVFLLVAAFVFAAGGILLIIRFVTLLFVMIFSPLLFAATVFPQTSEMASKLWHKLFSSAFFAPVYIFLLLISLRVLEGIKANKSFVAEGDALSKTLSNSGRGAGTVDAFTVVLMFIIAIMFLIMSLTVAKKMGAAGADKALSLGNTLRGKVQSAIGRNTVGRFSNYALEKYEKFDAKTKDSKVRKYTKWATNAATLGVAGAVVNDRNIRGALETGKKAKFGGAYSFKDDKDYAKERKSRQAKFEQVDTIKRDIATVVAPRPAGAPAVSDAERMKMESSIAKASTEQLQSLLDSYKEGTAEYREMIANISSSQFENLMKLKPDELNDSKKATLRTTRQSAVQQRLIDNENRKRHAAALAGGPPAVPATLFDVIGKADSKDLDALDFETMVVANARGMSSKQVDDMSLTPTAKAYLKAARQTQLEAEFALGAGAAALFSRITNDAERAKLPTSILKHVDSAEYLNVNVLNKILDNDSVTSVDRTDIRRNVQGFHFGGPREAAFNAFFSSPLGSRY